MKFINLFVFALIFGISSPVYAQSVRSLQSELNTVKEDVEALQRLVQRSKDTRVNDASDTQLKMMEMDELFRLTTGKVDELEHKVKSLESRVDLINKDIDMRLKMLEENREITSEPKDIVKPSSDATDAKTVDSVDDMYKSGMNALKSKDNQTAINIFNKILAQSPNHKLAGNAQYWLGEVYYEQKDFEKAAIAFAKGYEKYKKGNKGADSLLKLGMSMVELKKKAEACTAFVNLSKEFPQASAVLKTKASELAKKNSCK